jgi:hypothetical protein
LSGYLHTDERADVLCSLRQCARSLNRVLEDVAEWKWVILSLHSALQGAMVCYLSGSANVGALSNKCVEAWITWRARDCRGEIMWVENGCDELGIPKRSIKHNADLPPKPRLAEFRTLLERLRREDKRIEASAETEIVPSGQEARSVRLLNRLRNQMVHFAPCGWYIQLAERSSPSGAGNFLAGAIL